jgi:hypothetical protein
LVVVVLAGRTDPVHRDDRAADRSAAHVHDPRPKMRFWWDPARAGWLEHSAPPRLIRSSSIPARLLPVVAHSTLATPPSGPLCPTPPPPRLCPTPPPPRLIRSPLTPARLIRSSLTPRYSSQVDDLGVAPVARWHLSTPGFGAGRFGRFDPRHRLVRVRPATGRLVRRADATALGSVRNR